MTKPKPKQATDVRFIQRRKQPSVWDVSVVYPGFNPKHYTFHFFHEDVLYHLYDNRQLEGCFSSLENAHEYLVEKGSADMVPLAPRPNKGRKKTKAHQPKAQPAEKTPAPHSDPSTDLLPIGQ